MISPWILPEAFELGDDLAVEIQVVEAEHQELNWSNGHSVSSGVEGDRLTGVDRLCHTDQVKSDSRPAAAVVDQSPYVLETISRWISLVPP